MLTKISLEARGAAPELARTWAEQACRAATHGTATPRATAEVALAVHELARNVAEHAYRGQGGTLDLDARIEGGTLQLRARFGGGLPRREAVPPPVFDGSRERGFGVYLIESAMDRVEWGRCPDGRACVLMFKELA